MKITHKFYLNLEKGNENKHPLYVRFTIGRTSSKRSLGYSLTSKEWNPDKEESKLLAVNQKINQIRSKLFEIQFELQKQNKEISSLELADLIFEKSSLEVYLVRYFEEFANHAYETKKLSKGTHQQYFTSLTALKDFLKFKYGKPDINIKKPDLQFVEEFDAFLHQKNIGLNTIGNKYHKKLKTVFHSAVQKGIINHNPYALFKIRFEATHRQFLTEPELKKIENADLLGNQSLEKIRDMFLFSCYTGLRFSDAIDLQLNQINEDNGYFSIYRPQNKTGETLSIPLIPEAVTIINKYDNIEREITGKVFPKISNQKFNLYLKALAQFAKIDKELTHHIARHTCATTLLNRGVSIDIVSKYLGHTSTKPTRIYAKMQDETMKREILKAFRNN
jgi:integrase